MKKTEKITFSKPEQKLLAQLFKWCQHNKRIVTAEAMERFGNRKMVKEFIRKLVKLEFFTCGF